VATLDQLPAEQRAIIDLVLQRGRSYDELADMLGMTPARVRELAREALTDLSPVTAERVERDRRGQIVDYVLKQQSGAEETATKAHLRRSEAARTWTLSLVDSLSDMYDGARPEIPEAEAEAPRRRRERDRPRGRERVRERDRLRERRREREPEPEREREPLRRPARLTPAAEAAVRRRRIIGGAIAALALVGIVVGVLALTGGDSGSKKAKTSRTQPRVLGVVPLRPVGSSSSSRVTSVAILAQRGSERDLIVQAKLTPTKQGQAYEVWLYNSQSDAVPVGAQVTDQNGNYAGAGKLPADISKFKFIDVSLQTIPDPACQRNAACLKRTSAHSGDSVLRGAIADMRSPSQLQGAQGGQVPGGGATTTGP